MVKMCGNEAMVISKRFDGNWGHLYTRDLPPFKYFLAVQIPSFISRGEFDALRLLVSFAPMSSECFLQSRKRSYMICGGKMGIPWGKIDIAIYRVLASLEPCFYA